MIKSATVAKGILNTTSGGVMFMGFNESNSEMILLGIVGIFLGVLAFLYEHAHSENRDTKTKLEIGSELGKYVVFGGFAMPAVVHQSLVYVDDYSTALLAGGVASYIIVELLSTVVNKGKELIKEYKK